MGQPIIVQAMIPHADVDIATMNQLDDLGDENAGYMLGTKLVISPCADSGATTVSIEGTPYKSDMQSRMLLQGLLRSMLRKSGIKEPNKYIEEVVH